MPMLEGKVDHVIGVDTHRDTHCDAHTAAVLDPGGRVLAELAITADQAGYQQLLQAAGACAPGRCVWALEGSGCFGAGLGAGLADFLAQQGEWVVEIDRPKRSRGRNGANNDALDAIRAGREAWPPGPRAAGHTPPAWPPRGAAGPAHRVLHTTRAGIIQAGADARRQLKALIVALIVRAAHGCSRSTPAPPSCMPLQAILSDPIQQLEQRATVRALRLLAQPILAAPCSLCRGRRA
jgi:transposase